MAIFLRKCIYKLKQNLKLWHFVNKRHYFCSYADKAIVYKAKIRQYY